MMRMRGHVSAGFFAVTSYSHFDAFTCIIKICCQFKKKSLYALANNMTKTTVFALQK